MKKNLTATSIIEALVVLMIVVSGIVGVYGILYSSRNLADATSSRIEAIQIARDGLEAFTNIRDTNWTRFSADYANCWNVMNYNNACIGDNTTTYDMRISSLQGIRLTRNINNQFQIGIQSFLIGTNNYSNSTYRNNFAIQKDSNGFYTQAGGTVYGVGGVPYFTREIQIDYLNAANVSQGPAASNNPKIKVTSIVQWVENGSPAPKRLEMSTILTNWKAK